MGDFFLLYSGYKRNLIKELKIEFVLASNIFGLVE